jgi:hypothetical protein
VKQPKSQGKQPDQRNSVTAILIAVFVLLLLVGSLVLLLLKAQESSAQRQQAERLVAERQAMNRELGLPRDYPADVLPLWPGAEIKTQEEGEVKSTDGQPMKQWKIHAETDDDKTEVYEHYNQLLLGQGMSQTLFASVPSGYGVTYANQSDEIQLTIEKKLSDERTQIEITFSRLRSAP